MVTKEYLEYPLQLLQHGAAMVLPYLEKVREVEWTPWVVSGIGLGLSLVSFVTVRTMLRRGPQYSKELREKGMRTCDQIFIEDILVNGIEEAVFNETLPKKKAYLYYKLLGEELGFSGLLRKGRQARKLHPYRAQLLKEEIKGRLANGVYAQPAPLPNEPILNKGGRNKSPNASKLNAILGIA